VGTVRRGGIEFTAVIRAGCVSLIPSVESCRIQARIFELMQSGRAEDEAEAERLYAHLAPLITFLVQSIDQVLCYGKRLTAGRLGIAAVHDRQPAQAPTAFGLDCLAHHAAVLDRLRYQSISCGAYVAGSGRMVRGSRKHMLTFSSDSTHSHGGNGPCWTTEAWSVSTTNP
jgi:hypothetical protein